MSNPLHPRAGGHHHPEPHETVLAVAQHVKMRSGTQRHRLLKAYRDCRDPLGLNPWEAAVEADLTHAAYWVRTSELLADGCLTLVISLQGSVFTRPGRTDSAQQLMAITPYGRAVLREAEHK